MWGLPGLGIEPTFPALAGRFFTTMPPGTPCTFFLKRHIAIAQSLDRVMWKYSVNITFMHRKIKKNIVCFTLLRYLLYCEPELSPKVCLSAKMSVWIWIPQSDGTYITSVDRYSMAEWLSRRLCQFASPSPITWFISASFQPQQQCALALIWIFLPYQWKMYPL